MSGLPYPPRFIDLPLAIRQRIYEHFIPCDEVQFPTKSLARPHCFEITECDRNCRNLLLACRLVYNELAPIVYSTKHFIDQYRTSHLQRLQRLTPTAIQSLAKLTIFLNVSSVSQGGHAARSGQTILTLVVPTMMDLSVQGHRTTKKSFRNGTALLTILHHIFNHLVFIYTSFVMSLVQVLLLLLSRH